MLSPIALPVFAVTLLVAADQVPTFNVQPSCRAATTRDGLAGNLGGTLEMCMKKEHDARDEIAKGWAEFQAADKSVCVPLSTAGGSPTYTELLTCLEMRRDARVLREKDKNSGTTGLGPSEDLTPRGRR
jgi:hypothetical protein